MFKNIYNDKKVLITGNTGFKGSWLSLWLHSLGAKVYGLSVNIPTTPSNYETSEIYNFTSFLIGSRLNRLPPYSGIKLSIIVTFASSSTSLIAKFEPIKPAPPVIKTFFPLKFWSLFKVHLKKFMNK